MEATTTLHDNLQPDHHQRLTEKWIFLFVVSNWIIVETNIIWFFNLSIIDQLMPTYQNSVMGLITDFICCCKQGLTHFFSKVNRSQIWSSLLKGNLFLILDVSNIRIIFASILTWMGGEGGLLVSARGRRDSTLPACAKLRAPVWSDGLGRVRVCHQWPWLVGAV